MQYPHPKIKLSDIELAVRKIVENDYDESKLMLVRSVTVFCDPKDPKTLKVLASRSSMKHRSDEDSITITIGKMNYREKKFMKQCIKAKCKPKKVWLRFFPEKKKKS